MLTNFSLTDNAIELQWDDGHQGIFHHIWLRDNCSSSRHPDNGQRIRNPIDLPEGLHPLTVELNTGHELNIKWAPDGHASSYDTRWLRKNCYSHPRQAINSDKLMLWKASNWPLSPTMTYQEISTDKSAMRDWLKGFQKHGVALLSEVPRHPKMVTEVGQLVSFIVQNGWQAEYYDVRAKPEADVIADTLMALPAHTDDPYFNPPPQVNVLHCIENEGEGGESTLSDGFSVAEAIRQEFPEQFDLLTRFAVHFQLNTAKGMFVSHAPVIQLDKPGGEVEVIRYSNQSTLPFDLPVEIMGDYYQAYRTFSQLISDERFEVRFKLQPGDIYMIDNYRLLHGRTALSSTAPRHMQACYISRDGLQSRLATL